MKLPYYSFIFCLILISATSAFSQCNWENLGPSDTNTINNQGTAYSDLAIDGNDHSYLVFSDGAASGKITARKYNGTSWSTLGASGFSAGQATYNSIAIDANNIPYVAYCDQGTGNRVIVKKFDGTNWTQEGLPLSTNPASYTSLAIDGNNVVYVAFRDGDNANKVTVKMFNGTNWVVVGTAGFSAGAAAYVSLAISNTNVPYVVYQDGGYSNKATVKKFDGAAWTTVGTEGFSIGAASYADIAINSVGVPYVSYADAGDGDYANVKMFDGTNWITLDSPTYSVLYVATYTSITFDNNDVPHLTFRINNGTSYGFITVCQFSPLNQQWEYVGNASFSGISSHTAICFNSAGIPFVGYIRNATSNSAMVARINSEGRWQLLETPGFSEGESRGVAMAVAQDGTPYVVYIDKTLANTQSGWLVVKKFNGTNWERIENAVYNNGQILDFSIAIDNNGTPFVALINNTSMIVRKYNGSTWESVGTVSGGNGAYHCDIAIDNNNVPYISYRNGTNNNLSVKKYNIVTGLWVDLTTTISTGTVYNTCIKIAPDNTAYTAFRDFTAGNKATVRRYVNNAWQTIGPTYSITGQINYLDLAIDATGTPYIVYQDYSVSQKITVKKFNGTNWVTVGAAGFSAGQANWPSISINEAGVPYVTYEDVANGSKISVMKFNGTSWVQVGVPGFSANPVGTDLAFRTVDIGISENGTVYTAYWNNGYTAAKKWSASTSNHQHTVCTNELPFLWNGDSYTNSGTYQHTLTNTSGCDSIVTLFLTVNNPATGIDNQISCGDFTWIDNNIYTTSNHSATHTIVGGASNGCDSTVTLNLTIHQPTTGTDIQTACESFVWIDGNTYFTNNNTATHTLTNSNNCDSIVTLNLTILHGTSSIDSHTECGSFTWINGTTYTSSNHTATHTLTSSNSCDSIVTLDLTILPLATGTDVQLSCGPFTWINGSTYNSNNQTAVHTIQGGAQNGCDSIVTLNLTVTTINTIVSNNETTLSPNDLAGNLYQWIDCNTGQLVFTGQVFHPTVNGSYKVIITKGNCADTSTCYIIDELGLKDADTDHLVFYPNPTKDLLYIDGVQVEFIRIRSLSGQEVLTVSNQNTINVSSLASGCYLLEVNHQLIKTFSKE